MVIDASVALKWVLGEDGSDAAESLRDQDLVAPSIWLAEAGSALWRGVRLGQISDDQALKALAELIEAPVALEPSERFVESALQLAIGLRHPIYDCLYLAVAIHHRTHVVTADRRFASTVARHSVHAGRVRLLGA